MNCIQLQHHFTSLTVEQCRTENTKPTCKHMGLRKTEKWGRGWGGGFSHKQFHPKMSKTIRHSWDQKHRARRACDSFKSVDFAMVFGFWVNTAPYLLSVLRICSGHRRKHSWSGGGQETAAGPHQRTPAVAHDAPHQEKRGRSFTFHIIPTSTSSCVL